ncbi:MAG: RidA family protein [Opitutales bacterium]|nr:RidA family protein [Opitutales bacterium]
MNITRPSRIARSRQALPLFLFATCWSALASASVGERLSAAGITLPEVAPPVANYVSAVRSGNLVFLAGAIPRAEDGSVIEGQVGRELTVEEGYAAARNTGIHLIAALRAEIGDLEKVRRWVKVEGYVNAPADFSQHPAVINGCSDLLVEIFGDRGRHARVALGAASLPLNACVEIAAIVEVAD